jgi:hypothetical protein
MPLERVTLRIDSHLKKLLKAYADHHRTTMSEVGSTAISEYLDPTNYRNLSLTFLQQLHTMNSQQSKETRALFEVLATFVRIWASYNVPEDRKLSREEADKKMEKFLRLVATNFDTGDGFRDQFFAQPGIHEHRAESIEDMLESFRRKWLFDLEENEE